MSFRTRMIALLLTILVAAPIFAGDTAFDHSEQFILSEINRIRAGQGLSQLRLNEKLCAIARSHSSNMAETGYLSHIDSLGKDFKERLGSKIGERYFAGENIATNNFPEAHRVAVEGWRQSPNHLKNILNERFTDTGIGIGVNSAGKVFFTQIFLGK